MKRTAIFLTAATIAMTGSALSAADDTMGYKGEVAESYPEATKASKLIGAAVVNPQGEEVGTIRDILLDEDLDQVKAMVIVSEGEDDIYASLDSLTFRGEDSRLTWTGQGTREEESLLRVSQTPQQQGDAEQLADRRRAEAQQQGEDMGMESPEMAMEQRDEAYEQGEGLDTDHAGPVERLELDQDEVELAYTPEEERAMRAEREEGIDTDRAGPRERLDEEVVATETRQKTRTGPRNRVGVSGTQSATATEGEEDDDALASTQNVQRYRVDQRTHAETEIPLGEETEEAVAETGEMMEEGVEETGEAMAAAGEETEEFFQEGEETAEMAMQETEEAAGQMAEETEETAELAMDETEEEMDLRDEGEDDLYLDLGDEDTEVASIRTDLEERFRATGRDETALEEINLKIENGKVVISGEVENDEAREHLISEIKDITAFPVEDRLDVRS